MRLSRPIRLVPFVFMLVSALVVGLAGEAIGACGPFSDVTADAFCPFVLEIFYLGITTGTSPTTYDPTTNVTRLQMAAFLSRTVDSVLIRGRGRATLDQFWTTQSAAALGLTTVGAGPKLLKSDGSDIWVANSVSNTVSRVRASDGKPLETWTGAGNAFGVVVAMGRVIVSAVQSPGSLYAIDPIQPAGAVTTVASNLGNEPAGIAFDGSRVWTANGGGSISIVSPGATIPWTVTTVAGFNSPLGILYDSANVWVTDLGANTLLKLDSAGSVLQTVTVGSFPQHPAFDGTNIWVPTEFNSVVVVRASSGAVLQTLTGNGLGDPLSAAFDGQRILVTNVAVNSVSLWKAADLTPLGWVFTGASTGPFGACSDGINFWITLSGTGLLARF